MLVPSIFILFQFWTNSIPFFGKQVFVFLMPLLFGYAAFVAFYDNEFMVHLQPLFSVVLVKGHVLSFRFRGEKFDPFGDEGDEIFISLYPTMLMIMSIPSYFILRTVSMWKIDHI